MTLNLFIKKKSNKKLSLNSENLILLNNKNYYNYNNNNNNNIKNEHLYKKFKNISKFLRFTHRKFRQVSIYHTKFFDKFLGHIIKKGKKSIAENILYNLIYILRKRTKLNPFKLLHKAVINSRPMVEVKSVRKSGRSLEMPQIVKFSRQFFLAIKWLVKSSQENKETMINSLSTEILEASKYKGKALSAKKILMKRAVAGRINQSYKYFNKNKKKKKIKFKRFFIDVKRSVTYIEGSHKKNFII